ncbi:DUF7178 family protein [Streptomyces olivaceus]|uniref:DUF7178 family protein n=1 Tax=Streptomyces olivaceus TaxID=47716 RepID=UPI003FF0B717
MRTVLKYVKSIDSVTGDWERLDGTRNSPVCYRAAAQKIGEVPSKVQAVTWVAHIERK